MKRHPRVYFNKLKSGPFCSFQVISIQKRKTYKKGVTYLDACSNIGGKLHGFMDFRKNAQSYNRSKIIISQVS